MLTYVTLPYAALAKIQFEFDVNLVFVWLIFDYTMCQTVTPDNTKWHVELDGVEKSVSASLWQDPYVLRLTIPTIAYIPDRLTVAYDGPGPVTWRPNDPARKTLETTWGKQWEPFGPILGIDITT